MNEKSYRSCKKFHRLGKSKFILIMVLFYILVGNISTQIINIIDTHKVILTFRQIITPTIVWTILGICFSIWSWKNNETAYNNHIK